MILPIILFLAIPAALLVLAGLASALGQAEAPTQIKLTERQ